MCILKIHMLSIPTTRGFAQYAKKTFGKKPFRLKNGLLGYLQQLHPHTRGPGTIFTQTIEWCCKPTVEPNLTTSNNRWSKTSRLDAQHREKIWGNKMTEQTNNGQWTTKLGEWIVREVLERSGEKVWRPVSKNGMRPDWETDKNIWEVKTRSWSVSGTAGEKILGTPWKYADVPRLYGKPLKIVCVAYQEWEARNKFHLFDIESIPANGKLRKKQLKLWKEFQIEFVAFSDLLLEFIEYKV